jgi:ACS family tartrate transporter-like MFS transporter
MKIESTPATIAGRTLHKVSARILPFFFILYVVSYMDRANVGFAKLAMLADLRFSEEVFGLGAGIFFLGYFLLEIPGAIIVERWSARLWISRIMVTWGIFAVLVGFIRTPTQFYCARFMLGLAEAGFFPGLIVYMTHWFPERDRARALAGFILGVPISFAVGAPLSALMLKIHWLGLPGWRWLFILQGLPAVICGIVTLFYLTDHPRDAQWLDREEREWLTAELERERTRKRALGHVTILQAFRQRNVLLLAALLCVTVISSYGYLFWLPTTIQKASGFSVVAATSLSTIPYALATVAVWFMGRSSDRTGERKLHTSIPLALAGVFFGLTIIPGQPFWLTMIWLSLTGMVLWAWAPSYWVLPTLTLRESAAAASIGLINSIGNLGGFIGPSIVGALLVRNHSYSFAALFLSLGFLVASALTLMLRIPKAGAAARL